MWAAPMEMHPLASRQQRTTFTQTSTSEPLSKGLNRTNKSLYSLWNKYSSDYRGKFCLWCPPASFSCLPSSFRATRENCQATIKVFFKWLQPLNTCEGRGAVFPPPSSKIHFYTDQYPWKLEEKTDFGKQTLTAWKQGKNMMLPSSVLIGSRLRLASLPFFSPLLPFTVSPSTVTVVNKAHPSTSIPLHSKGVFSLHCTGWAFIPSAAMGSFWLLEIKGKGKGLAFSFLLPGLSAWYDWDAVSRFSQHKP